MGTDEPETQDQDYLRRAATADSLASDGVLASEHPGLPRFGDYREDTLKLVGTITELREQLAAARADYRKLWDVIFGDHDPLKASKPINIKDARGRIAAAQMEEPK